MLKKTITYPDYNGGSRTEDFYFNLTQAEVTEMEIATFKDIILRAYGEKSPDGKRFVKSQELRDAFSQTEAYSILFMELATNADAAAAFINGIVPAQTEKRAAAPAALPTA